MRTIRNAARVAVESAWRFSSVVFIALLITGGPCLALLGALLGPPVMILGVAFLLLFPLSIVLHEFGHSLTLVCFISRDSVAAVNGNIRGQGTWFSAEVLRPRLTPAEDIAVTMLGPLTGLAAGVLPLWIVVYSVGAPIPLFVVLFLPFLSHILALTPMSKDGQALQAALKRRQKET